MNLITDIFLNRKNLIVNLLIFLSLPIYIIIRERFIDFSNVYYCIFFTCLYFSVLFQKAHIYIGKTTAKQKLFNYVIIPFSVPVLFNVIVNFVTSYIIKDQNPQELPSAINSNELFLDLISDFLAGSEEIWRFAAINVICLMLSSLALKRNVILTIAVILSSFLFGWLHTFNYTVGWFDYNITITLMILGLCFGLLFIITKNIWTVIITHIMFDVSTSLSLYNMNLILIWRLASLLILGIIGFYYLEKTVKRLFKR
ncbi:CPBP family intramembrane metalloprotease [Paenibacillus sp. HJL G12]|uniref:CPBP family intramembrane metalloprotease n=1 Tax=Paenibacillus dendrobii TaxID=2691084 RepID=A0A7X3IJH6_9BACL|nr:CPBP family intramembrane metalloprotease [Paenibacillus dendrobii]